MRKRSNHWILKLSLLGLILLLFFTIPAEAFYLPDTGQTTCYSDKGKGRVTPCPLPGDPLAQDGSYTINPPSYTVIGDGTVFDNNTWLMWQQTDDGIMRSWSDAKNYCDSLTLGGYDDWRLPEKKEIESIVNYGQNSPAIDSSLFPNTKSDNYWSSTQYTSCDVQKAWYVHFGSGINFWDDCTYERSSGGWYNKKTFQGGNVNFDYTSTKYYVRCIRGGPLSFGDFIDNGNGTATDLKTGLMWQQDEARDNKGGVSSMKWSNALDYCEGLSLGGYSDWRLPNIRELLSLTDDTIKYPSINTTFFPNVQSDSICSYGDDQTYFYWTSTTNTSNTDNKLTVSFERGFTTSHQKRERDNFVRCVRGGGQSFLLDDREIKVEPTALDFLYRKTGESKSLTITVSNIGITDLVIGNVAGISLPFSIMSDGCSGKTLSALMSCSITVAFNPIAGGTFTGILTIPSNDADNPAVTINLSGSAIDISSISTFLLPHTGQTTCYNDLSSVIFCPAPENSLAQDGSYLLNPPSYTVDADGMATDNNTKLMWQRQDDNIARTWNEAINYCESLTLGGYTNWRLPTKDELFSIVDFGSYSPSINLSVFPNTKTDSYWTSSSNQSYPDNAWYVFFGQYLLSYCCAGGYCGDWYNYGGVNTYYSNKSSSTHHVRCVRGKELPYGAFEDKGDGTVTDLATGLMWQRGDGGSMEWIGALAYCEGLSLGGYSDWRLPNARELESLTKENITSFFFQENPCSSSVYWSSTSIEDIECNLFWADTLSYIANPLSGWFGQGSKFANYKARCVRGGNTISSTATLTGLVTDSSTGQPISDVSVTVNDSPGTHSATTDSNGVYTMSNLAQGNFTATFEKSGYIKRTVSGILTAGQTLTLNIQLNPISPLTLTITSPVDGAVLNTSSITVTCSVSDNAAVTVNGIQASVNNNTFSATISLNEGSNTITATANDQYGQIATASISVTLLTKGTITGTVTDSSSGLLLPSATIAVTDSLNVTQTVLTDINGAYTISAITSGAFNGSVSKDFYNTYTFSGTMSPGQTITINAALSPVLPTISNLTVSNITTDSATINWQTDQSSDSLVEYGETISYGNTASDSALVLTHSLILTGLSSNTTYHFSVTSKNVSGISSSSGDGTFMTSPLPQAITLTITSPADGETISRSDIAVRGTITNSAGNETGVTVNGIVATVYGNEFIANHVPLTEGANTITATATDTAGSTVTASVTVNAVTTENYIRLTSNIESGIAPLEATLKIDGSFSIETSTMSVDNATGVEWLSFGYDEYSVRLNAEGIYTFTATATGTDGNTYHDTIAIIVLDQAQLDALLRTKWNAMKTSLSMQDITTAMTYISASTRAIYQQMYNAIIDQLPAMVATQTEFNLISITDNTAIYEMVALENGEAYSYEVIFIKDANGQWVIQEF